LEFSHLSAAVAGRVLADLGAEVVRIERRGGDPARWADPVTRDRTGAARGLGFLAHNLGKRSVTIDIDTEAGSEIIARLAATADIVVLDWERIGSPAEADRLHEICTTANPRLVWCEIWPYGRGEYEMTPASELTLQAQGGHLYLNGEIDRAPVSVGAPVASSQAGVEAASAALMAYYHARRTGEGQRVDVSVQACVIWTLLNTTMTWQCMGIDEVRGGSVKKERGNSFFTRLVWRCADGYVQFGPVGGGGGAVREASYATLVAWMRDEGFYEEILDAHDWNGEGRFAIPQAAYDEVTALIGHFIEAHTLDELIERGMKRRILLAPIYTIPQLLEAEQLNARGFYRTVNDDARGISARVPGPFARLSATPLLEPRPAPLPGADTTALLTEAGFGDEAIALLTSAEVV